MIQFPAPGVGAAPQEGHYQQGRESKQWEQSGLVGGSGYGSGSRGSWNKGDISDSSRAFKGNLQMLHVGSVDGCLGDCIVSEKSEG